MTLLWFALAFYTAMSLAAFALYAWDKHGARTGARRIRERTLHAIALLGGWPGAALARHRFRHKTRRGFFAFILWISALLHAALWTTLWLAIHGGR